ncbi:endoglucanase II [Plectosphaerella plurivora]|uniref:lytic cellulose monooxygenase (C4-dehydrogenating) n=1 Tax=Plectosphaerella plurivora TaxID=936078 RepID=A0A9P8V1S4_9PEZI|nr:endoglucanase II [Plectosphaerella plurivora]
MKSAATLLALASAASAHYVFRQIEIDGQGTSDWQIIRQTANFETHGPVEDVTSELLTCYELNPDGHGATTLNAQAGATVSVTSSPAIFHPGPAIAYLARVPAGVSASDFDGKGAVWFKFWQDAPDVTPSGLVWPTMQSQTIDFDLPECLEDGQYLLRVEHIGLHTTGAPQFYLSCAQINVSGGSGSYKPAGLLSFPGAYSLSDPGLAANLYWPIPTSYEVPGGPVGSC